VEPLAWADVSGTEGAVYRVDGEAGPLELTLETAAELPSSGRAEGSFRLEFRGPFEPILPQGTYRFVRDGQSVDIFVVPVGRDAKGTLYEAVFY